MRKIVFQILFLFLLGLIFTGIINAHVQKTNNSVGLILHVDPNDEPVAGKINDLRLIFTQLPQNFDPRTETCLVEIIDDEGQQLFQQDLFENWQSNSIDDIHFNFKFPKIGIYKIIITGKSFKHQYDLRVDKSVNNFFLFNRNVDYFLILILLIILTISSIIIFKHLRGIKKTSN